MKHIHEFASARPLAFAIVATLAWMVIAGIAAHIASVLLKSSLADGMAQSLGTLAVTAGLLLVMWRWGWLRPSGITALGGGRLWLVTGVLTCLLVVIYQVAFFGQISMNLSSLWAAGEVQAILGRQAVVGFVEETLFRGFLLYALAREWGNSRRGVLAAVAVPALIFGLTHILQLLVGNPLEDVLMTMLNAVIGGLWYGTLVLLGGSLWPVVIIHAATNASVQIGAAGLHGFDPSAVNYALAAAAEVPLIIAGFWLLLRKMPGQLPVGRREQDEMTCKVVSSTAQLFVLLLVSGALVLVGCIGNI